MVLATPLSGPPPRAEPLGLGVPDLVLLDPHSPDLLQDLRRLHAAVGEVIGTRLRQGGLGPEMLQKLELSLAQQSRAARLFEERLLDLGAAPEVMDEVRELRVFLAALLAETGLQLGRGGAARRGRGAWPRGGRWLLPGLPLALALACLLLAGLPLRP